MKLTLTIKDYHNGGGDLTIALKSIQYGDGAAGSVKFYQLIVTRKPDKHSTRLGMFAYIRNTKPGYHSLGFPQLLLIVDFYSDDDKFLSRRLTYFYDVAVRKVERIGDEEQITFIARDKSPDIAVSKIVLAP